jgi:hypothetical protein
MSLNHSRCSCQPDLHIFDLKGHEVTRITIPLKSTLYIACIFFLLTSALAFAETMPGDERTDRSTTSCSKVEEFYDEFRVLYTHDDGRILDLSHKIISQQKPENTTFTAVEDCSEILKYLKEVIWEELMTQYHPNFLLDGGLQRIVLTHSISYESPKTSAKQKRVALPDLGTGTLYLDISPNHGQLFLRHVLHHELFHLLNGADPTHRDDSTWAALNPPGFQYEELAGEAAYEESTSPVKKNKWVNSCNPEDGFVTRYATTAIEEDKSEIFALIMSRLPLCPVRQYIDVVAHEELKNIIIGKKVNLLAKNHPILKANILSGPEIRLLGLQNLRRDEVKEPPLPPPLLWSGYLTEHAREYVEACPTQANGPSSNFYSEHYSDRPPGDLYYSLLKDMTIILDAFYKWAPRGASDRLKSAAYKRMVEPENRLMGCAWKRSCPVLPGVQLYDGPEFSQRIIVACYYGEEYPDL